MKKRWKWTLFKKIFLMLMVSFVLINVINVYLDFQNAKENSYKTLEDSYFSLKVREMEGYFHYENDNLDQPFYDKVSEAFTSKLYSTNNVLIIDNNGGGEHFMIRQRPKGVILILVVHLVIWQIRLLIIKRLNWKWLID